MSVIIRLQNLPWNANALDIRRFFQGLSIPDGGVHIIGGEKGDAFIAFSTDEDARQAMMKDASSINGFQVRLLLSSKTEMQNVIAAAKGGPPPPAGLPPAAPSLGIPQKPVGFYERTALPPAGGAAPTPYIVGGAGADVTGSGQGLRSSTGLQATLPPAVAYGYPSNQMAPPPAQPAAPIFRMNEPARVIPAVPSMPPTAAARSVFDVRPSTGPQVPVNLQQPSAVPMDPVIPGLRPALPGPPIAGAWTSQPPAVSQERPPADFGGRPADIAPGNQAVGFNAFNASGAREPPRMDAGQRDVNYPRNGQALSAAEIGRNLVGGIESGRNLGPPPDVGRDFRRGESSLPFGRAETGVLLGRAEERRDGGRFMGDRPSWSEREAGRPESGPGQGWLSSGRSFGGRDVENDSRREFQRPDADRRGVGSDRWMENRSMGRDRDPRDMLPNDRPLPRPGAVDPQIDLDRYGPSRSLAFSDSSRFGPETGSSGVGGMPDGRPRDDSLPSFGHPKPGFHEPARRLMEEPLRRPLPPPEQRWADDRRGFGPPGPGFDGRPPSPQRDRYFPPGCDFPPREEPWHDGRRDVDPRQMRDPGFHRDLCVCAVNFPRSYNYREVRRFFLNCEIPRDGVKLINDRMGLRTGVAFVRVTDARSLDAALGKHGKMAESCRISIERCTNEDFDRAIDGALPKRNERSRSPRSRGRAEENSNLTYFVLKKLPSKAEKDDIRKFLGKFQIAADGGPFFELTFDKSQTGNALVAIEEKDPGKVLTLHRTLLNGTRVDVIKINSYEFEERSRRARQCEQDEGVKDTGQNKSAAPSFARDKQEPKSKEQDRGGNPAVEDDGRRQVGSDASDQRTYCVELRGVPYTAAPVMIQDFFRPIEIPADAIHIVYNREHRATGIAYAELGSIADQKRALEKNKQRMGHRFVEIRALNKIAMVEEYNRHQQKFGGSPILLSTAARSTTDRPKQGSEFMLSMQNLHFDTQLEDILEFFSGYHPVVESIKLQYKDSQPTGDGLIAFETLQEAESALRIKNRHMLLGKPISLSWPKN